VWTEAHLKELVQDYWLIARPMDERFRKRRKKNGHAKMKVYRREEIVELMRRVCTAMTVARQEGDGRVIPEELINEVSQIAWHDDEGGRK
jgi:hypothetical protein